MAIRKQNRCPACGNVVEIVSMVYSATSQTFVCPSCLRAGTRPPIDAPGLATVAGAPTPPPPPAVDEDVLSSLASMRSSPQPQIEPLASDARSDDWPAAPP